MQSKNKKAPTKAEQEHIKKIKSQPCSVCDEGHESECHEMKQGQWYTSIALCADCHRGSVNGIHGQKRMWSIMKMDELDALSVTLRRIFEGS